MSIINNICEHGHLQRKCEVCDLRAEIARLRSVCREAVSKLDDDVYPLLERGGVARFLLAKITCSLADAGKEPSDGK